uniref:Uncharacterized protein n=1 Tax=Plectus sambesii TaxID=2011161 RepID=A0A914VWN1_9BILA
MFALNLLCIILVAVLQSLHAHANIDEKETLVSALDCRPFDSVTLDKMVELLILRRAEGKHLPNLRHACSRSHDDNYFLPKTTLRIKNMAWYSVPCRKTALGCVGLPSLTEISSSPDSPVTDETDMRRKYIHLRYEKVDKQRLMGWRRMDIDLPNDFFSHPYQERLSEMLRHYRISGLLDISKLPIDTLVSELSQPMVDLSDVTELRLEQVLIDRLEPLIQKLSENLSVLMLYACRFEHTVNLDSLLSFAENLVDIHIANRDLNRAAQRTLSHLTDTTLLRIAGQQRLPHRLVLEIPCAITMNGVRSIIQAWINKPDNVIKHGHHRTVWSFYLKNVTITEANEALRSYSTPQNIRLYKKKYASTTVFNSENTGFTLELKFIVR